MTRLPTHVLHSRVQVVRNGIFGRQSLRKSEVDRLVEQLDSVLGELAERGREEFYASSATEGELRR